MVPLPVFLPDADRKRHKTTKVIYNALMREDGDPHSPPVRSRFDEDWPQEIQERVLARFPDGAAPPGMLAGMQSAGGQSLQA